MQIWSRMRPSSLVVFVTVLSACGNDPPLAGDDDGGGDAAPGSPDAAVDEAELDEFIESRMAAIHVPGLAAAIVKDGEVVWSRGYGLADIAGERPVTPDTIFMLASISKTITATAVMQLVEDDQLDLDAAVGTALGFPVTNPAAAGAITTRMLLAHSSSIQDNWDVLSSLYVDGDSPIGLGAFMQDYLTPAGDYYDAGMNFYPYAPGAMWNYSNVAVSLSALVAEERAGMSFETLCADRIFAPLGMTESAWHLATLEPTHLATPYRYTGSAYEPIPHYGYPDYPDGALRTSAAQLARFLAAYSRGGELDGARILDQATIDEMWRVQAPSVDPTQGLVWYHEDRPSGAMIGHGGSDSGVATEMLLRLDDGVGVIVLMNGDWSDPAPVHEIEDRLFEEAAGL